MKIEYDKEYYQSFETEVEKPLNKIAKQLLNNGTSLKQIDQIMEQVKNEVWDGLSVNCKD